MSTSETVAEIQAALAKAQAAFPVVEKGKANPFFKSKYASHAAIYSAIQKHLANNAIGVWQPIRHIDGTALVVTRLTHASGEFLEDEGVPILMEKQTMQAFGSGVTYARRYGLQSCTCVVVDDESDDDGNKAVEQAPTLKAKSSKDPDWTGPLGKTDLKNKCQQLVRDIGSCEDLDSLIGLQTHAETDALVAQLEKDAPKWFDHTPEEDGQDYFGIKQHFTTRNEEINAQEAE